MPGLIIRHFCPITIDRRRDPMDFDIDALVRPQGT
jgi:hypothetical protein